MTSQTHVIQRRPFICHLHDLHACVHSLRSLHILGDGDLRQTEHPRAGLVEFRDECSGEFGAGVDAGAEAEVDRGAGPWVFGLEDEGAAGQGPGGARGG